MKHQVLFPLTVAAFALSLGACNKPTGSETTPASPAAKEQDTRVTSAAATVAPTPKAAPAPAASVSKTNVLIFRNIRSWRRKVDFEEALTELGFKFDVRPSAEMAVTDLSPYAFVIIPGAQWRDDFYHQYADNADRFANYVTNGGTLVLELNGAERDGITLPGGARMVSHGATDNALALPTHPILNPLSGKPIHANYASHGYLEAVPKGALILATEMTANEPLADKPTFVEYSHGAGRVIAACQCFHDQDGSGRGILMETTISYAAEKQWFSPKK